MNAQATRAFTPGRIVALVLIGLAVLGLGYLRLAPGDRVSVPEGAKAGDLILEDCDYATEDGGYAADCGTLVVPENRADPQSRLIAVPVTRIRARSAEPGEPIFRLEGGPGLTNMQFARASRFVDRHDVVLVRYRGVDGSVRLDCPEVESALAHSTDVLAETSFRAYANAFRSCADRLTDDGIDLSGYGLVQQVEDMEAARIALGYDRIDLVSESAGTRTAMIYAWRHPRRIHRSVMIGVNPPGHFLWEAKTTDEQLGRYAMRCSEDASCHERTDDLAASMGRTSSHLPDRWLFLPVEKSNVRVASFFALTESTAETPFNGPKALDAWLSVAEGDASGLWLSSLAGELVFPKMFVWGQYAAAGIRDAQAVRAHFSTGREPLSNLGSAATAFAWGGGRLADAWPASPEDAEYTRVRTSNVETLLIGGALDFSTPPRNARRELLPYLPNGDEVVLDGFGHSTSFWSDQPEAGTRLIGSFLDTGRADSSLYEPQRVDFTPTVGYPMIAKIVAGSMLGLAALTVLSLLWMAVHVRNRGRFGRRASATMRSIYPIVLGIGGWLLGVLVVLTTMPAVPLDDELLAALSVGAPIGLGLYLAWVDRVWSARTKVTGFALAVAGALVGGWLGFETTEGLSALLTAIVGAVAGGNLLLVGLDITWDRQARSRFSGSSAMEILEPRSSTG